MATSNLSLASNVQKVISDFEQCRRELDFLSMPQPVTWANVEAWSEKCRLLIFHFFPDNIQRFEEILNTPQWSKPEDSFYRVAEDPKGYAQALKKSNQREDFLAQTMLSTVLESTINTQLYNQGVERIRRFVDGLIVFLKNYGIPSSVSKTETTIVHSRPTKYQWLSSALMRKILKEILVTDSELDAFCLDYHPVVHQKLGSGMDRTAKINLVLTYVPLDDIYEKLSIDNKDKIDQFLLFSGIHFA